MKACCAKTRNDLREQLYRELKSDLEGLGFGTDESISGAQAVDYLAALYEDLKEGTK